MVCMPIADTLTVMKQETQMTRLTLHIVVLTLMLCPTLALAQGQLDDYFDAKHVKSWVVTGQNQGPTAAVKETEEKTPDDQAALAFDYDITPVTDKLSYTHYYIKAAVKFETMPKTISFQVKGDAKNHPLRIVCRDANGRTHQWTVTNIKWNGWQKVDCDMKYPRPGYGSWGGKAEEKEVKLPLQFIGFVIDRRKAGDQDTGTILIGGATVTME